MDDAERIEITGSTLPPLNIEIRDNGGNPLLTIKPDGSVEGTIENASEAGRAFVQSLRDVHGELKSRLETLTAENERLKQFAKNAERCAHHGLKGDMLVALGDIKREARAALQPQEKVG
jgi:hypothetical protein